MGALSNIFASAWTVLPYALAVLAFYFFLRTVYHVKSPVRPLFLWPIVCALIGTGLFMLWGHNRIAESKSQALASGNTFTPPNSFWIALAGYVVAWALFYVFRFALERVRLAFKRRH
jgi:ABC-type molybdate transport system permease subunit